jgi:hypothetical protein
MGMLDRRLQVDIGVDRLNCVKREGSVDGVPVAVLVREPIDERFPGDDGKRRSVLQALLDAEPMVVPQPAP